jgi:hypothetical protein
MTIKERIKITRPQLHFGLEHWKYYMPLDIYVSSFGRIKDKAGEIQKLTAKDNYLVYKNKLVHRIVLQTFHPVPNYANLTVDHLDHNTRNNNLSNLEWVTREENTKRAKEDHDANINCAAPGAQVYLNGVKILTEQAKALMMADKSLKNNKKGVEDALKKVASVDASTIVAFGNYTLQKVEG